MKNRMLKSRLIFYWLLFFAAFSQSFAQENLLQFVESVPVETNLGIKETHRTLHVWLEMIGNAKRSIDIEIFYLSNKAGEPLEKVIEALQTAARGGAHIRIIDDAKFYKIYPVTLDSLNNLKNIEVRSIEFFNEMGGVQHGKYFVVDSSEIFLGSQNFDWRSLKHIHEFGVRIRNRKLAAFILNIFNMDWNLAAEGAENRNTNIGKMSAAAPVNSQNPVTVEWRGEAVAVYPAFSPYDYVYTGMELDEAQLLKLINGAKNVLNIQLLSYDPAYKGEFYPALDNALRSAAVRGVQIRLLVSDWNTRKPGIDFLKSLQVLPNIEVKLSTIPQYSGGFIPFARVEHCKFMTVDDSLSWVGTSNWGKNYFYNSRNLALILKSKAVNRLIKKVFLKSWNSQYTHSVDPSVEYEVPRIGE